VRQPAFCHKSPTPRFVQGTKGSLTFKFGLDVQVGKCLAESEPRKERNGVVEPKEKWGKKFSTTKVKEFIPTENGIIESFYKNNCLNNILGKEKFLVTIPKTISRVEIIRSCV